MGTFLTILLGVPAAAIVGWRLARPSQEVIEAAAAKRAAEQRESRVPGGRRHRRDTQPADGDAYAEAVNFNLGADNGVVVDAGGEAA